jgi:hypothetical protein
MMTELIGTLLAAARLNGHTLTQLVPAQALGMAERTARNTVLARLPVNFDERYDDAIPERLTVAIGPLEADPGVLRGELSESPVRSFQWRNSRV